MTIGLAIAITALSVPLGALVVFVWRISKRLAAIERSIRQGREQQPWPEARPQPWAPTRPFDLEERLGTECLKLEQRLESILTNLNRVDLRLESLAEASSIAVAGPSRQGYGEEAVKTEQFTQLATDFVTYCDQHPVDGSSAEQWLRTRGVGLSFVSGDRSDWYLARLERAELGLVTPAMRRPMGQVPLADYFELTHYNGVDPLKPQFVRRFPQVRRVDGSWQLETKGLIDAT